jgi:hypothetical protein
VKKEDQFPKMKKCKKDSEGPKITQKLEPKPILTKVEGNSYKDYLI